MKKKPTTAMVFNQSTWKSRNWKNEFESAIIRMSKSGIIETDSKGQEKEFVLLIFSAIIY